MGLGPPLQNMHKKPLAQKLLEVTPAFADRQVAMMIADRCVEIADKPYRFAINHDIGPPEYKPCPLSHYDWAKKDRVGIDTSDVNIARRWLTSAALRGYTIFHVDAQRKDKGLSISIFQVRQRASYAQRSKDQPDDDDDIPF